LKSSIFSSLSKKIQNLILLGFIILSSIILFFNPGIFTLILVANILAAIPLMILSKKVNTYFVLWLFILFSLKMTWKTIDIKINKSKYYYALQPFLKYPCLAAYNLDSKQIELNVHCKNELPTREKLEINALLQQNKELMSHLKQMDCYSINFSENWIQLWCNDRVIDIKKSGDNSIEYETSDFH